MNKVTSAGADYNGPYSNVYLRGNFQGHVFQATVFGGNGSMKTIAFRAGIPKRYHTQIAIWLSGRTQQRRLFRLLAGQGNPQTRVSPIGRITAWPF